MDRSVVGFDGQMRKRRAADDAEFESFVAEHEPRLRRAFVAAYGADRGREATAEALAYAWVHWPRVRAMANPAGYLYRVGQSRTRGRRTGFLPAPATPREPWYEPALAGALADLSDAQRTAVVLVHGFGWTLREVAELTGVKPTTVQNHLERGLTRLRNALEVHEDA
jgi:DNA-directed RNA polymerase specialized sigma24 family protein